MGYVGNGPTQIVNGSGIQPSDIFTGTGSQTAFTLSETPSSANAILVFLSGIEQNPTTNYTLSGSTLTFITAPGNGDVITVVYYNILTTALPTSKATFVRQTVQSGSVSTAGAPNFISTGTGLACNLAATATNVNIAFAGGSGTSLNGIKGSVDYIAQITSDQTSYWGSIPASNISYLSADLNIGGGGVLTATQTLAPPQYGFTYDQTKQTVLQFGGSAGSTTFLDDFGNTWTAQGGAKIQTNQFKFGTGALGGGGTSNALNGTTDYVSTTNILSIGNGGWAIRCWIYPTVLPANGTAAFIAGLAQPGNSNLGVALAMVNNGGTTTFGYYLSSTGATNDIANNQHGTTTVAINTWYWVELTFDQAAGIYRLYVGTTGNASQEQSTTSSVQPQLGTTFSVGGASNAGGFVSVRGYVDKFEFLPYCQHPAGTAYAVPSAAPSVSTSGYASNWFNAANMTMNNVSGTSITAGSNPTFTQVQRVYMGECQTGSSAVSSTITYSYQGEAFVLTSAITSTTFTVAHNLGLPREMIHWKILGRDRGSQRYLYSWTDLSPYNGTYPFPATFDNANTYYNDHTSLKVTPSTGANGAFFSGTNFNPATNTVDLGVRFTRIF